MKKILLIIPLLFCACSSEKPKRYENLVFNDARCFPPVFDPHPRDAEDMQHEIDNERYKYERDTLDIIDRDNAPHSNEDAKNWA